MPIRSSIIYPYLAAMGVTLLDRAGFDVEFLDCPTMEYEWKDIGFLLEDARLIVLEARTPIMKSIWETCDILHSQYPKAEIVLYGDHVSWNPYESIPWADYIIRGGDDDKGVLSVCKAVRKHGDARIVTTVPLTKNLDKLPFCDRNLVSWKLYYEAWKHREKFVWTMSQRGCYYRCSFCAWAETLWKNKLRYRTPGNVVDEYGQIYDELGECEVLDDADLFDTQWGLKFAEELLYRGYRNKEFLWAFQTHPNMIHNLKALKTMRKAGRRTVKLGIESGNQITLNRIAKCTTIKIIEKAIRLLKEANIMVHANLIVGWPWETKEMAYHTIDWIKKLDPNQAQFSLLIPYPNTAIYEEAEANGWFLIDQNDWSSFDASVPMLKMEDLTPEEIVQLYKDCWSKFYLNWKYIMKHILKVRHWEGVKQLYRGFNSIYRGHMRAVE